MTALILIATLFFIFFIGYRMMNCLDHALDSGAMHPYWDSEDERIASLAPPTQKKAS